MALLTATRIAVQRTQGFVGANLTLYTFGSPRVGNSQFVDWFLTLGIQSSLRVVNERDPVPAVPPRSFVDVDYRHVPTEASNRILLLYFCNEKHTMILTGILSQWSSEALRIVVRRFELFVAVCFAESARPCEISR